MKHIKQRDDIKYVINREIALAISNTILRLEAQYEESYQATLYGWFVVCEDEQDLIQPFENLSFSLSEKLNMGEIEFVEKKKDWFEIYIMLNDNEGILVYVPKAIFEQHQLRVM